MQGSDDPGLLRRRYLCAEGGAFEALCECLVGHLVEIAAGQHVICYHTDFAADLTRDDFVVAGQDLYLDARARQGRDPDAGAFLERVEKGDSSSILSKRCSSCTCSFIAT